jgi:hypothetical protein
MSDAVLTSAVTGATAVLSGLLGYGAARGQLIIEKRRLEHEVQQTESSEIVGRRDLYLEYLGVIDASWRVIARSDDLAHAKIEKWWDRYNEVDNRVELLSTDKVRSAAFEVWKILAKVKKPLSDVPQEELSSVAGPLWDELSDDYADARADLVQAMRSDVNARLSISPPEKG